ncbi:uncharacterized protein C2orf74 homolog [Pipistrellus kuhlii]|uniref:uncharacterized protein C2orf74 homolog n=1 Tax=Pipistrellus kuhlii TaxID=59472 RepID=UPI00174EFC4D|nr:uncharacterized protein C2orf74 homolog [Pipistrellus kuhlii]
MSSDTIAIIFFIFLLIGFTSIFFLLMLFLYKCFQSKKTEETEKGLCEDCFTGNVQTSNLGDQEKTLRQIMKPGILVHRQSKEMLNTYWKDKEDMEGKIKENLSHSPLKDDSLRGAHIPASAAPSVTDDTRRPLKGVTFSREVIVVNLGEEHPAPHSHIQEPKERK